MEKVGKMQKCAEKNETFLRQMPKKNRKINKCK